MQISSYSPFKYIYFRSFALIDEFKILKVAILELAYFLHLISIDNYFELAKKVAKNSLTVKNEDGIFYCRRNTTDLLHVLPSYEKKVREFMNLDHGVFVDIGAHIGSHTVRMAKTADYVYAFEPTPSTYNTLLRNIQLNNCSNITALPTAISDRNGKAPLFIDELNTGENSLTPSSYKKKILVETQTFDRFLEENDIVAEDIKLLKIDVEGAEDKVFQGAKEFLKNFKPRIIFESLDRKKLGLTSEILESLGYKIMHISSGTNFVATRTQIHRC